MFKRFNFALPAAFAVPVASLAFAPAADAAIDVSGAVTAIEGLATPVGALGLAVLILIVAIKGFKWVRRAL